MHIISYRGPCSPGGVSGTLGRLYANHISPSDRWWYFSGQILKTKQKDEQASAVAAKIPEAVVAGHYRYCNDFIWPVMHGLPEFATFNADDQEAFRRLNLTVAGNVLSVRRLGELSTTSFVNDYQFSLLPNLLSARQQVKTFWHIPWPVYVSEDALEAVKEIAEGLLGSESIGFHTLEYANNFLRFVDTNLKRYRVDFGSRRIFNRAVALSSEGDSKFVSSEIIVQPIGIDAAHWEKLSDEHQMPGEFDALIGPEPFIISVDRADYTKGVRQRLKAIDRFFHNYPEFIGKVKFVQVCQQSRSGLDAFDRYYEDVRRLSALINAYWNRGEWRPIVWIDQPVSSEELAGLYRRADGLLVTAVRDGLNLTVKEYIACTKVDSSKAPGVLLLSPGAGVWQEVSRHALAVAADVPEHVAGQLAKALKMTVEEKQLRAKHLKNCLNTNTLLQWWQVFGCRPTANLREIACDLDNFA